MAGVPRNRRIHHASVARPTAASASPVRTIVGIGGPEIADDDQGQDQERADDRQRHVGRRDDQATRRMRQATVQPAVDQRDGEADQRHEADEDRDHERVVLEDQEVGVVGVDQADRAEPDGDRHGDERAGQAGARDPGRDDDPDDAHEHAQDESQRGRATNVPSSVMSPITLPFSVALPAADGTRRAASRIAIRPPTPAPTTPTSAPASPPRLTSRRISPSGQAAAVDVGAAPVLAPASVESIGLPRAAVIAISADDT